MGRAIKNSTRAVSYSTRVIKSKQITTLTSNVSSCAMLYPIVQK